MARARTKWAAAGIVLLALLIVPAPLLPPHWLAEAVQAMLGVEWKVAYLLVALGLQVGTFGSLGALSALALTRHPTLRGRLLQVLIVPLVIAGTVVLVRSLKSGHLPLPAGVVIPVCACLFGAGLGLGLLYRGWKLTLPVAVAVVAALSWILLGGPSAELSRATAAKLARLVAAGPGLPAGEARFGALLQTAFAPVPADKPQEPPILHNRAAILALGIAVGHERLARFAGLDPGSELVRAAIPLRQGATLGGREDWPRHYALSAALAVLEHPLLSDAAGLLKEELDALTHGSGFSFGDLAADRAGVRFAVAATNSDLDAQAMQARLQRGFTEDEFFIQAADLPENLTTEQFRGLYGAVGSQRYRQVIDAIEVRLDRCPALSVRSRSR